MIRQLLESARQRLLYNQLAAQFTVAVSLVLGAVILLLLAGTQLLDWRLLALLVACAAIYGIVRTIRKLPSLYQVAVLIDRRAQLFDSLSTAFIFEIGQGTSKPLPEIASGQRIQAETMAREVDLESALPFTMPRAVYAMGILFLIATSLFALRYGMSRNLDLKAPLPTVVMDAMGWNPPVSAEKAKKNESRISALLKQLGINVPEPGEKIQPGNLDEATDAALESVTDPDLDNSMAKNPPGAKSEEAATQGKSSDPSSDPDESSGDQATANNGNPEDSNSGNEAPEKGQQQAAKSGNAGENSSLLSKLKDALNNMMSKSPSKQASGAQKSQSQQAQNGAQSNDKGQPGQGKQEGGKDPSDSSQDGQQQGDSEAAQNSPGKGGGKSNDRDASSQPGSGIGKQDGAKDLRAAQQEKAMGKLSEVIGKRSQNVSGEMTVEVQSSSQQLKTGYTQKNAQHSASGGELSRDEVPLDMQGYVSGYFEEIRKSPAKTK